MSMRRRAVLAALSLALLALVGFTAVPAAAATVVVCSNHAAHDTSALKAAISLGGTVQVSAGTCALNDRLLIRRAVVVQGAGANQTLLVQHAAQVVFQITAPGVTIAAMNLDVATRNPGLPPDQAPPAVLSGHSHTTLRDLTVEAGTGFGIRVVGPAPCDSFLTTGTVVSNVNITSHGRGGFASLDISCTNGATLTNVTINGNYIALYHVENVTLRNEVFVPDAKPCQAPAYITGPARNISIDQVTGGGHIIQKGWPLTNITITNDRGAPGC
jgi:hypothetical protein